MLLDRYMVSRDQKTSFSDFRFAFGAAYRIKLGEEKSLNLGATTVLSQNLTGNRETTQQLK